MKKKMFTRPVSVMFPAEMFNHLLEIANRQEIALSEYIREAVREKLQREIRTDAVNLEQ
jgi:hypothetical protein